LSGAWSGSIATGPIIPVAEWRGRDGEAVDKYSLTGKKFPTAFSKNRLYFFCLQFVLAMFEAGG
jgi:hypothetical protein